VDSSVTSTRPSSYDKEALLACGHGELFGPGNARLPLPNMLMMDRITHISDQGGKYGKGEIIAELDIQPDLWFFDCHSASRPRQPGRGRALGVSGVKFSGQVLPTAKRLTYHLDIKRVVARGLILGIADGRVSVDGRDIYHAEDLRVGLFTSTDGF